jgi:hypothetical protein
MDCIVIVKACWSATIHNNLEELGEMIKLSAFAYLQGRRKKEEEKD